MKKFKRSWNWTEKNLRKSKSYRSGVYANPPKNYIKWYTTGDRESTRRGIQLELSGEDYDFPRRTHRSAAKYDYW